MPVPAHNRSRSAGWKLVLAGAALAVALVPARSPATSASCGRAFTSTSGDYSASCSLTYTGNPISVAAFAVGTAPNLPCTPLAICEPDTYVRVIVYDPVGSFESVFCAGGVVAGTAGVPLTAACANSGTVSGFNFGDKLACLAVASNYGRHSGRSVRGAFRCSSHVAAL
jgi:hypothetical protein